MKTRYKILTAAVSLSLILSLVCVNALAFDNFDDIPGVKDDFVNVYADDYVVLNCGTIDNLHYENSHSLDIEEFTTLYQVSAFLDYICCGSPFELPDGISYESSTVCYLEFFLLNRDDGSLESLGIFKMGQSNAALFGSGFFVNELWVDQRITYNTSEDFLDLYDPDSLLLTACYLDGFSPYDGVNVDELQNTIEYLEYALDQERTVSERRLQLLQELRLSYDELQFNYNKLTYESGNRDDLDLIFTGTTSAIVSSIQGLSSLGFDYNRDGVNDVTLGGILVLAILGAFLAALVGAKKGGGE